MRKKEELSNPDSCLNKAADDEFLFVLKDKDLAMVNTIRFWIKERIRLGLNKGGDSKIVEAGKVAQAVQLAQMTRDPNF